MGWNAAKSFCVELGTTLAILNSQANVEAVASKIKVDWAWIALHRDPKNDSRWLWIDGTLTNYTNWDSNQPNNGVGGTEDCVAIMAGRKWHDWPCKTSFRPICEINRK